MSQDVPSLGSRRRVRWVILALAAVGGWLDGLTFVALDSVFVSAVTGDLVQVGIAAADGDAGRLVTLLVALGSFLAGTSLAVILERTVGATAWPGPVRRPLLVHAGLVTLFAALWVAFDNPESGSAAAAVVVGIAALSAGVQGAAILDLGIRGASVNAVTGVMTMLGAGLAERGAGVPGPRPGVPWWELASIVVIYSISGLVVPSRTRATAACWRGSPPSSPSGCWPRSRARETSPGPDAGAPARARAAPSSAHLAQVGQLADGATQLTSGLPPSHGQLRAHARLG